MAYGISKVSLRIVPLMSGPSRENLLSYRNLLHRTGEIIFVFSSPAGDMDLNGFQTAILHSQAELFIDFPDAVLLEAIAHGLVSARHDRIAMLIAGYFGEASIWRILVQINRICYYWPCAKQVGAPPRAEFHGAIA